VLFPMLVIWTISLVIFQGAPDFPNVGFYASPVSPTPDKTALGSILI
jgi:hypothetical protein